jgi:hypothetical protein
MENVSAPISILKSIWNLTIWKNKSTLACDPNYLGDWDWEDCSLRPAWTKKKCSWDPTSVNTK